MQFFYSHALLWARHGQMELSYLSLITPEITINGDYTCIRKNLSLIAIIACTLLYLGQNDSVVIFKLLY